MLASLFAVLPITGGTVDTGDDAVVYATDGRQVCTGTLVAPYVVVTAAHCLVDGYRGLTVVVGPDASGAPVSVVDGRTHPLWDPLSGAHDIGVLFLGADVGVAPVALPAALDAELPGATVRLVGFGETASGAGDGGVKREGTAMIVSVRADEIDLAPAPSLACVGDSGGPVLLDAGAGEVLAAVVSRGDAACTTMTTAIRVDAHLADFITPYLAATAPGTAAAWARCLYPAHCAAGLVCVTARDEPLITYCAPSCVGDDDPACPDGTECVAEVCQYELPTPGAFGSACGANAECASELCAAPAGETDLVCSTRCVPGLDDCPADSECLRVEGASHACFGDAPGGCCGAGRRSNVNLLLAGLVLAQVLRASRRDSSVRRRTRPARTVLR